MPRSYAISATPFSFACERIANTGYHRIHAILIIHYHNYCLYPARATLWKTLVWDWCVARSCSRWWSKDYPKKLLSQCRCLSPCGVSWFHSDPLLRSEHRPYSFIQFFPIPCCIWTHNKRRDKLLSHRFLRKSSLAWAYCFRPLNCIYLRLVSKSEVMKRTGKFQAFKECLHDVAFIRNKVRMVF